ncbi:hypothetical protein L3081_03815 [Colwellia sp. MSW7]|jgi:hypothetical protein|uniref:Flagellar biosynthesis protein FlgE n=1 Tax=Colwellia maritima TaxID=2912588 RepID=A0ABS9WXK6_9GAMM|nr:hypothetical protein [Colwellia maritima]MCI2282694.1 hypothetical protein [Colwellia maritima]
MEIQSAFNSGVQGFQNATETANQAAANIVAETTVPEANTLNAASASSENKIPDLNQSIVDLKVAEYQAKASVEVIKTADDTLGTLLDVTA